jgi:hypothetical protein
MGKPKKKKLEEMSQEEMIEHVNKLEEELKLSRESNTRQWERVEELSKIIRVNTFDDHKITHNKKIQYEWYHAYDSFYNGIRGGFMHMVTPLDAEQSFDAEDWARLTELEGALKQLQEKCSGIRESIDRHFVDASMEHMPEVIVEER